jgi:hypothetical protein
MNIFSLHKNMVVHHWSSDKVLAYYISMSMLTGIIFGTVAGLIFNNIIVGLSIGAFAGLFIGIVYGILKSDVD